MDSQYPNGHFLRCIGRIGDLETETEVILLEHELTATPFSKVILAGKSIKSPFCLNTHSFNSWFENLVIPHTSLGSGQICRQNFEQNRYAQAMSWLIWQTM